MLLPRGTWFMLCVLLSCKARTRLPDGACKFQEPMPLTGQGLSLSRMIHRLLTNEHLALHTGPAKVHVHSDQPGNDWEQPIPGAYAYVWVCGPYGRSKLWLGRRPQTVPL